MAVAVLLACVLSGGLAGLGVVALTRHDPVQTDGARPLAAISPSLPTYAPEQPYAADVVFPALQPGLTYRRAQVGVGPYGWTYDVPTGWVNVVIGPGERKSVPVGSLMGGYSLRTELVLGQRLAPKSLVEQKLDAFRSLFEDVHVLVKSDDMIALSYRDPQSNWLRYNTFRWFADTNGTAAVEVSVAGRSQDLPGLDDLLARVWASIEPAV